MYFKTEAMAVLHAHLQGKTLPARPGVTCFTVMQMGSATWDASYNNQQRLWEITATMMKPKNDNLTLTELLANGNKNYFTWSDYERTKSIVATGDDPLNQMC